MVAIVAALTLYGCGLQGLNNTGNTTSSTSSGGDILGSVLGSIANGETVGNVLGSILGTDKPTKQQIIGTWTYRQPGVAFTSENLLAKAGGEAMATNIKERLKAQYSKVGITTGNTQLTLTSDNRFTATVGGKTFSGSYSYDVDKSLITLQTLLFSMPCYAKNTTTGMSFLFESKKLLTLMQALSAVSGSAEMQTIGEISKNYDGVRIGFDMSR